MKKAIILLLAVFVLSCSFAQIKPKLSSIDSLAQVLRKEQQTTTTNLNNKISVVALDVNTFKSYLVQLDSTTLPVVNGIVTVDKSITQLTEKQLQDLKDIDSKILEFIKSVNQNKEAVLLWLKSFPKQ